VSKNKVLRRIFTPKSGSKMKIEDTALEAPQFVLSTKHYLVGSSHQGGCNWQDIQHNILHIKHEGKRRMKKTHKHQTRYPFSVSRFEPRPPTTQRRRDVQPVCDQILSSTAEKLRHSE
jgi:hypothetical protein